MGQCCPGARLQDKLWDADPLSLEGKSYTLVTRPWSSAFLSGQPCTSLQGLGRGLGRPKEKVSGGNSGSPARSPGLVSAHPPAGHPVHCSLDPSGPGPQPASRHCTTSTVSPPPAGP